MTIQILDHASLFLKIDQIQILVDPFISGNPKAIQIFFDNVKDLMLLAVGESIVL